MRLGKWIQVAFVGLLAFVVWLRPLDWARGARNAARVAGDRRHRWGSIQCVGSVRSLPPPCVTGFRPPTRTSVLVSEDVEYGFKVEWPHLKARQCRKSSVLVVNLAGWHKC